MRIYNFNLNEVLKQFSGVVWKTTDFDNNANAQWLNSLIKPIKNLYINVFQRYRDASFYDLSHSGQVVVLEHYINKAFNYPFSTSTQNSIFISDIESISHNYIYKNSENYIISEVDTTYLYNKNENEINTFLYNKKEYGEVINYAINAPYPQGITEDESSRIIKRIIERYRLAGASYIIKYY